MKIRIKSRILEIESLQIVFISFVSILAFCSFCILFFFLFVLYFFFPLIVSREFCFYSFFFLYSLHFALLLYSISFSLSLFIRILFDFVSIIQPLCTCKINREKLSIYLSRSENINQILLILDVGIHFSKQIGISFLFVCYFSKDGYKTYLLLLPDI